VSDLVQLQVNPIKLSCGGYHTAVVVSTGEAFLWGRNTYGQCGRSPSGNISSQFLFSPQRLQLEIQRNFKSVDCGDQHTAVVTPSGDLYTFGDNSEGQLGLGIDYKTFTEKPTLITGMLDRVVEVACGYRHTLIVTERGSVFGTGTNRRFELGLANQQNPI
jgi:alpha-tubulin suppressor-like RCC1 family protein